MAFPPQIPDAETPGTPPCGPAELLPFPAVSLALVVFTDPDARGGVYPVHSRSSSGQSAEPDAASPPGARGPRPPLLRPAELCSAPGRCRDPRAWGAAPSLRAAARPRLLLAPRCGASAALRGAPQTSRRTRGSHPPSCPPPSPQSSTLSRAAPSGLGLGPRSGRRPQGPAPLPSACPAWVRALAESHRREGRQGGREVIARQPGVCFPGNAMRALMLW